MKVTVVKAASRTEYDVVNWFSRESGTLFLGLTDGRKIELARHAWFQVIQHVAEEGGTDGSDDHRDAAG